MTTSTLAGSNRPASASVLAVHSRFPAALLGALALLASCRASSPDSRDVAESLPNGSPTRSRAVTNSPASPAEVQQRPSAVKALITDPEGAPSFRADPPKACGPCENWNAPRKPFRVYGNTYYVGTAGLSAILVVGSEGSVLLDGGLTQSAARIAASVLELGFRVEDIRVILSSHAHYDHVGGIAALQRASGATVMASPAARRALERGEPTRDDPQFGFGSEINGYPRVSDVRALRDRETVRLGDLALSAQFTPGHTPGGTSWSWRSCESNRCYDVVYADSLTAISAPGFRYAEESTPHPRVDQFRASIARIDQLPCDILLAPHPGFLKLDAKLAARKQTPNVNPFLDPGACAAYAQRALRGLEERLAKEDVGAGTKKP